MNPSIKLRPVAEGRCEQIRGLNQAGKSVMCRGRGYIRVSDGLTLCRRHFAEARPLLEEAVEDGINKN